MSTTEITQTWWVVRAQCLNEKGETVSRDLGMVRGQSDNGQPGWTAHGATHFTPLETAQHAAKFPHAYSVYDAHYKKGGKIAVLEVTRTTVVTETTSEVEVLSP